MAHTIEVIEESKMNSICYSVHFGFSALSLSHSSGAWGFRGGEVRNLLHGVWSCTETAPRGLAEREGKEKNCMGEPGVGGQSRTRGDGDMKSLAYSTRALTARAAVLGFVLGTAGLHLTSKQSV